MPDKPALVLLLLCVLLAHWPTGPADFSYDDADFIEGNASIRAPGDAARALFRPFPPEQPERGLYRPLVVLSYAVDHALFGLDPRPWHIENVALYALGVALALALARRTFPARQSGRTHPAAFAAALLFAVHPVHADAVDSVAARSELLALGFSLGSLLLWLRAAATSGDPRRACFASAGCFALACLSKETGAVVPGVLLVWLLAREGAPRGAAAFGRRFVSLGSAHLGVLALYLALRMRVLGGFGPEAPVLASLDPLSRLYTAAAVFARYLRLLVWPDVLQLDFYYQLTVGTPETLRADVIAGFAAAAALTAVFGVSAVRVLRGAPSQLGLASAASLRGICIAGLGTFFAFLLPVSHVFGIGALMAERFLFAPSLGFVWLVVGVTAYAGRRAIRDPRIRLGVGGVALALVAAGFIARSQARAAEWRDAVRLWQSALAHTPDDYRAHANLAVALLDDGRPADAEQAARRALELRPGERAPRINLAVALTAQGELAEAAAIYRDLVAQDPEDALAWHNLGVLAAMRGDDEAAARHFEHALRINPNFARAKQNLQRIRERRAHVRQDD